MPDPDDDNHKAVIFHPINDPISSDPDAKILKLATERHNSLGPRVLRESIQGVVDSSEYLFWQIF